METAITKDIITDKRVSKTVLVSAFVVFTCLSAFVRIPLPFTPVPITLQTFFVLLSGALLGRRLGALTQTAYLILGFTGQTVFTGSGSGALYLSGPTGGYISGFILASFFAGSLFEKESGWLSLFLKLLAADFLILLTGTVWLKIALSCSFDRAFLMGFLPFIPGDILKVALAAIVYRFLHPRIQEILS